MFPLVYIPSSDLAITEPSVSTPISKEFYKIW